MNLKSEFVKAIMSVLRLEPNIYTTGAIETIIDRLDVSDYQLFIAFLGERKSDFEKPIENIAKGVDEFYEIKIEPRKESAKTKANETVGFLQAAVRIVAERQSETQSEIIEKLIKKPHQLLELRLLKTDKTVAKIDQTDYKAIENIGFEKFLRNLFEYNAHIWLKDEFLKPYIKKRISERIEDEGIKEASQEFKIESSRVKQLLSNARQKEWLV